MNPARQGETKCGSHAAQYPGPLRGKRKGSNVCQTRAKKSADRECLAGGNKGRHCAKNQGASQASRKMPCGPAIAQKGQRVP